MSYRSFDQPDGYKPRNVDWVDCYGTTGHWQQDTLFSVKRGSYSGINTPNYRRRIKEGAFLPQNGYYRYDLTCEADFGSYTTSHSCSNWPYRTTSYRGNALVIPFQLWTGSDVNLHQLNSEWERVNTSALLVSAMADVLPELDLLTSLIEGKETVKMVLGARRDAKRLIREALRGGKHTVKAAADAWLTWRYGWQTLGYDLQAVYEAIKTPYRGLFLEGRAGESFKDSQVISQRSYAGNDVFDDVWNISYDVSFRANCNCMWSGTTLNALVDIPITAWELVPFSFVADWFVNVGDVLAAWKVRNNASRMALSLGRKVGVQCDGVRSISLINGWSGSGRNTSTERYDAKHRIPASSPSLVPSFDVQLSSKRLTDAAAILAKRIL